MMKQGSSSVGRAASTNRVYRMISFARGAPAPECLDAELLADCARAAILGDPGVLAYGPGGGYEPLRAWLGAAPRRRARAGGRHERRPAGLRLLRRGAARRAPRPRARRGADLRPAAEDPRAARRRGRARRDGRGRARPRRARARARAAARRASSTRSRPSRTRAGARSRPSGGAASSSSRASTACRCSRTIRTASSATRASRRRRCTSSRAASSSRTRPRSRRPSRPACGSAGSSAPAELAARIEARAVSNYISPPFLTQATVYELIDRGAFEPNLERIRGLLKARRDAMLDALEQELAGEATWSEPEGGYFLWVDLPGDAADLLARAEAAGVTFVKGARLLPRRRRREPRRRGSPSATRRRRRSARASRRSPRSLRLTAPVQLREQHAADEAGEQREQDHPDQRRARLAEDEVDRRLLVVAGDERDQVAADQHQQRRPGSRAAAASCGRTRRAATSMSGSLRGCETGCSSRERGRGVAAGAARAHLPSR